MSASKLKRLQATGWKVGTVKDFLGLSREEAALVELRLSLISAVKKSRLERGVEEKAVEFVKQGGEVYQKV